MSAKRRVFEHMPEATMQAYVGLPGVLIWCAETAKGGTVHH